MFFMNLILFSFMYLMSFHLVMNSDDWFLIWLGLEINMIMFIIIIYKQYSLFNVESCLKYFFIQSLGSVVFMMVFYLKGSEMNSILCLLLGYKMGAGPFFFWFPSVCSGISWMGCFLLMSFQKIIPFVLMVIFVSNICFFMVWLSLFLGIFGSLNQKDLKQLVAYSSIYHLGWMIMCIFKDDFLWVGYLMMYIIMMFPFIVFLQFKGFSNLLSMVKVKWKFLFVLLMMSMAGMPPFLGFFIKWYTFFIVFNMSFYFCLYLIISSVVMFYIYFRITYDILLGGSEENFWMSWVFLGNKDNNLDLLSGMGSIFGTLLMIFLLM